MTFHAQHPQAAILLWLYMHPGWHYTNEILQVMRDQGYTGRGAIGIASPLHALIRKGVVERRLGPPDTNPRRRGKLQRSTSPTQYRAIDPVNYLYDAIERREV